MAMSTTQVTLMAGPSTHGLHAGLRGGLRWLPPARRGDVDRLVNGGPPGVLVLCDGVFDAVPTVSHEELCKALDSGWQVWGVSSLGAIRAWELRDEGMRGFGKVYDMLASLPDFRDDEMCLLHCPEEPFFPVTEALVNVRVALAEHGHACGISSDAQTRLVQRLSDLWFGERSEELIRRILVDEAGVASSGAECWLDRMANSRIKNRDLAALLRERPWRQAVME